MKKILLTFTGILLAIGVQAQGTVNFANNAATAISNILTGARVPAGSSFLAQLYYGPAGQTSDAAFISVTNNPATFTLAGQVLAGARNTDIAPGAVGSFQIRAWEASLGANWDLAYANWLTGANPTAVLGKSSIIQVTTANPFSVPPGTPTSLVTGTGLTGFYLTPVPEPSVIALGALGLAAILWRRRK
jgi:hypothetical protein